MVNNKKRTIFAVVFDENWLFIKPIDSKNVIKLWIA